MLGAIHLRRPKTRAGVAIAAVGVLGVTTAATGTALALTAAQGGAVWKNGTIHQCYDNNTHVTRTLSAGHGGCKQGETGYAFNQKGRRGKRGRVGARGPAGPANVVTYNKHIITGLDGSTGSPAQIRLAKLSPSFVLIGKCSTFSGTTYAETFLRVKSAHSAVDSYDSGVNNVDFGPTTAPDNSYPEFQDVNGDEPISYEATGSDGDPDFTGANDGAWSAVGGNGFLSLQGLPTDGVYLGSSGSTAPSGTPACTFAGSVSVGGAS